jgi:hypothetical protein
MNVPVDYADLFKLPSNPQDTLPWDEVRRRLRKS